MVATEHVERSDLEPPGAQLFSRVASKATNVRPHHLESVELVVEVVSNRASEKLPLRYVVASPVEPVLTRAESRRASDDEGAFVFAF